LRQRLKTYALVCCLFVFLFVVLGGGLRLNPGGAFLGAATGSPVILCGFSRLCGGHKEASSSKNIPDLNGQNGRNDGSELLWNSLLVQSHGKGMV